MENNVLIFSDIHINDYANYNRSRESRLFQTRQLANLIIDASIKYNCDRMIIAGDVVESPIMKNNVLNEVKNFFNVLCSHFKKDNYIIYGQHDLSTKDANQDPRFSGLTALLPPNLYYADYTQFNLCGRSVAMMNWKPIQDLSWINGVVDLFIGHVTLAPERSKWVGQAIDQSKFRLSITGDIHQHFCIGNMVSIGSCVQNKLGDQKESTAIVWNPNDNSWKVIDLDPNRALLRLEYTTNRKDEGFSDIANVYKVYRPAKLVVNDSNVINIPKWSEVSDLVDKVIREAGLAQIHEEVLSHTIEDTPIDFNFIPVKLRIKDFRSIEYAEVFFDDMDKVTITGDNGAGKSSIILGLYYALRENRSLKDFIRFGADSCECEIEFIYQGVNNKILRGSRDYGCWVNGEKLPYNNKREFEDDMYNRYPFLNYTDIYFFNADRSTILGSLGPERKSEIISKMFRLDRIDSYNKTATSMYNESRRSIEDKIEELNNTDNICKYIENQLNSIALPNRNIDELINEKSELVKTQESYVRYMESKSKLDSLKANLSTLNGQVASYTGRINSIDEVTLSLRIKELESSESEYLKLIDNVRTIRMDLTKMDSDLASINSRGTEIFNQLVKVRSNICPTCGSKVVLKELENKLTEDMDKLLDDKNRITGLKSSIMNEPAYKYLADPKLMEDQDRSSFSRKEELKSLNYKLAELSTLRNELSRINKSVVSCTKELGELDELNEVKLPENFYDKLSEVNLGITTWNNYNKLVTELNSNREKLGKLTKELNDIKLAINLIDRYIKLTGSTGDVYKEVMSRISKDFSDDVIRYEVNQYKFRNKDHLDLDVQYNVQGRWVSYQSLSSGQKTMADLNFLSRILVECGLLVLDETLKHLSPNSTEYCLDMMRGMNVHTMILTSHAYGTESFANKDIALSLDDRGITKINVR